MDNLGSILAIAGAIVGLIIALAATLVFVRGAYGNARIKALREDNQDLRDRVTDTEAERDVFKLRMENLASENSILRDLTLQKANVDALQRALMAHNVEELDTLREYRDVVIRALEEHDRKAEEAWQRVLETIVEKKGPSNV